MNWTKQTFAQRTLFWRIVRLMVHATESFRVNSLAANQYENSSKTFSQKFGFAGISMKIAVLRKSGKRLF